MSKFDKKYKINFDFYERPQTKLHLFCQKCCRDISNIPYDNDGVHEGCSGTIKNGDVVEIDEEMIPIIVSLNSKGYRTIACCAGHYETDGPSITSANVKYYSIPYITFKSMYDIPNQFKYLKKWQLDFISNGNENADYRTQIQIADISSRTLRAIPSILSAYTFLTEDARQTALEEMYKTVSQLLPFDNKSTIIDLFDKLVEAPFQYQYLLKTNNKKSLNNLKKTIIKSKFFNTIYDDLNYADYLLQQGNVDFIIDNSYTSGIDSMFTKIHLNVNIKLDKNENAVDELCESNRYRAHITIAEGYDGILNVYEFNYPIIINTNDNYTIDYNNMVNCAIAIAESLIVYFDYLNFNDDDTFRNIYENCIVLDKNNSSEDAKKDIALDKAVKCVEEFAKSYIKKKNEEIEKFKQSVKTDLTIPATNVPASTATATIHINDDNSGKVVKEMEEYWIKDISNMIDKKIAEHIKQFHNPTPPTVGSIGQNVYGFTRPLEFNYTGCPNDNNSFCLKCTKRFLLCANCIHNNYGGINPLHPYISSPIDGFEEDYSLK